jgi:hypothetical protein
MDYLLRERDVILLSPALIIDKNLIYSLLSFFATIARFSSFMHFSLAWLPQILNPQAALAEKLHVFLIDFCSILQ